MAFDLMPLFNDNGDSIQALKAMKVRVRREPARRRHRQALPRPAPPRHCSFHCGRRIRCATSACARAPQVMRVLRLIKLVRLLRASRLFRRWETKLAINYSRMNLLRSVFNVCYISHFFACVWGLMVALAELKVDTWANEFEYCTPVANLSLSHPAYATRHDYAPHDCVPDGPWALYSVSVYWAVMTITSIGYGDIHAADKNISEQVVNTFLMLAGAIIWGNLIGTFCGVVATMSPHTAEFNRRMDDLNRYVNMYNICLLYTSPSPRDS